MNPSEHHALLLSRELDGELSVAESAELERALASTPDLRRERQFLRGLSGSMREGDPRRAPLGFADRVMARVDLPAGAASKPVTRHASSGASRTRLGLWIKRSASLAAALLLMFGAVYVTQLPSQAVADDADPRSTLEPEVRAIFDELEQVGRESHGAERPVPALPFLDGVLRGRRDGEPGGSGE